MNQENIRKTEKRIQKLSLFFESELPEQTKKLISSEYELRTVQPHIGKYYDCLVNKRKSDTPFRLIVMGLEALDEKGVDIKKRTEQILEESTYNPKSNNYMKGTTLLLQYFIRELLGYTLNDNEYIGIHNVDNHIFNYFTLSNWHVTGAFVAGNNALRSKPMNIIAVNNFIKQVEILEPSLVILQSKRLWLDYYTNRENFNQNGKIRWNDLGSEKYVFNNLQESEDYSIYVPDDKNEDPYRIPVIRFSHPSDRGRKANPWSNADAPYFKDIIKPVLAEVINNYDRYTKPKN